MVSTRGSKTATVDAAPARTRRTTAARNARQQEPEPEANASRRRRGVPSPKKRLVESDLEKEEEQEQETPAPASTRSPTPAKRASSGNGRQRNQAKKKTAEGFGSPSSSFEYEFGGPWGALGIIIGLPVVVLGLYFYCPNQGPGVETLRWADVYRFLAATLPTTLKGWAQSAKGLDVEALKGLAESAGAGLLEWVKALPETAGAQWRALVAFVEGELWDPQAFLCVCGWFLFQVLLERVLPGEVVLGVPIPQAGGKRLAYRLNGHLAFWVSLLAMGHAYPRFASPAASAASAAVAAVVAASPADAASEVLADAVVEEAAEVAAAAAAAAAASSAIPVTGGELVGFGAFPLAQLYDRFPQFAFAALVFSFLLAAALFLASFRRGAVLAEGGVSGNAVYDFYMGRELNPRTASFDWKYFCELRPGLIGWVVLNLGMLCAQHERHGGAFNAPLALVNLFQAWYVLDALVNERAILTTMDITTDGFGFMLAFGDLAWVPFTYSLQARYLVGRDPGWSSYGLAALSGLHLLGYWVFRGANSAKDAFRRDPASVPHIRFLETQRGTKLMTSGWWGWARKVNYTGDWLMSLSWCILCGPTHVLPYFYCIYFGVLLAHRAARDDHACALKYGADWDRYKKAVPSLFLPGIY